MIDQGRWRRLAVRACVALDRIMPTEGDNPSEKCGRLLYQTKSCAFMALQPSARDVVEDTVQTSCADLRLVFKQRGAALPRYRQSRHPSDLWSGLPHNRNASQECTLNQLVRRAQAARSRACYSARADFASTRSSSLSASISLTIRAGGAPDRHGPELNICDSMGDRDARMDGRKDEHRDGRKDDSPA
jgi:hypothetical protein